MDRTAWIVVSVCVLLLVFYQPIVDHFYPPPPPEKIAEWKKQREEEWKKKQALLESQSPQAEGQSAPLPDATLSATAKEPILPSNLGDEEIYSLENEHIRLEFTNHGGGIKRALLKKHILAGESLIELNRGGKFPIFNLRGWSVHDIEDYRVVSRSNRSVTYERTLPQGLIVERKYTLGENYLLTLEQTLVNPGRQDVTLEPYRIHGGLSTAIHLVPAELFYVRAAWYGEVSGYYTKTTTSFDGWNILGLQFTQPVTIIQSTPGQLVKWASIKNQFFATTIRPIGEPALSFETMRVDVPELRPKSQSIPHGLIGELTMKGVTVAAGQSDTKSFEAYLGPKEDARLLELPDRQDEIMEFGWMSWVSRPLLLFMNWINSWVGNYGWTIVILTIIIKAVLWYPQSAANRSMKKMQLLAPMMKELQEKHKNDATKLNEEMLKLYQEYGVNPVGGCLPLLVQFPIFIGFYYMLSSAIEMRHASFLWVADLSQPDTIAHLPIPGLFEIPINPMPLIMTASMFWSMRITPQPQGVDNPAMHMIKFMPFLFLFFCYNFSSALSLYWTVQNLLSIGQLYYNLNQPDPVLEKKKKPAAPKPAMNLFAPKLSSSTAPKKRRKR